MFANQIFKGSYKPILFSNDIPVLSIKNINLLNKSVTILRDKNNKLSSFADACTHRGAPLSKGRILQGGACIQCPYHGWEFSTSSGECKRIPQLSNEQKIPKQADLSTYDIVENDGIIWFNETKQVSRSSIYRTKYASNPAVFVTDHFLKANYGYFLQIENLLDPAHIHFVHDGFQGNKDKACPLYVSNLKHTDTEISARFSHKDKTLPDIFIRFIKPYVVDVSILNKRDDIVRKNIIYVTPLTESSCNVLFRDVCFKEFIGPANDKSTSSALLKEHVDFFINVFAKEFVDEHYQIINSKVVDSIMQQDIDILEAQQNAIGNAYASYRYVMPAYADRMIVEFKKWCNTIS